MPLRILHTNDFHGKLNDAKQAKLSELRTAADLYFDCGDCIKAGNLAVPLKKEEAWVRLDQLRCSASVLGNRETHVLQAAFEKKIGGATHPIVCANLRTKGGEYPFLRSLVVSLGDLRVGIIGVMVAMVTERMKTQAASAYLWDPPIATAIELAKKLRPEVDCLIGLTHIGLRQDRELAQQCSDFDLVLGAHSHDVLMEPEVVGSTAICQTGSHGRFAGVYEWAPGGLRSYRLEPLP